MSATKRNRTIGRSLALFLSACLFLGLFPAEAAAKENGDEGDLVLDKWVKETDDGFLLTLESYATGENGTVEQKQLPLDIVLVLDESGSMGDILVHGCNGTKGEDVNVTPKDHLAEGAQVNGSLTEDSLLFIGHKVFSGAVDTSKSYTVVYPGDGTTRDIHYCQTCEAWFSSTDHETHTGLAKWIPFDTDGGTPTNNHTGQDWTCDVQFYERCGRSGKEVLQEALDGFLTSLYEASNPDGGEKVQNRVAIVGYGTGASYIYSNGSRQQLFQNTGAIKESYDTVDGVDSLAAGAWQDVSDFSTENGFTDWVDGIVSTGGTPTHLGIQAAQLAFGYAPDDGVERGKVMILFTDGAPGGGYVNYGPGKEGYPDWVTPGIQTAKAMKDDGVTIYCVGLFPKADGYSAEEIAYDVTKDGQGTDGFFQNANCFLHLVSSNYPKADGVGSSQWGPLSSDYKENAYDTSQRHSYYLGSDDGEHLSEMFTHLYEILNPGSTTVTLNETAVVKDVVTNDFRIAYTDGTAKVTAYTMSYRGVDGDSNAVWKKDEDSVSIVDDTDNPDKLHITVSGQTVSVTNFDFAENYVHMDSDTAAGKKLVIEIEIAAAEGSQGGVRLATNTGKPGIYGPDSSRPVAEFPLPHVDLPTTVTVRKVVKGSGDGGTFSFEAVYSVEGSYEDLSAEESGGAAGDSNYLHLKEVESTTETFTLSDGGAYTLENVEVGYPLTIREITGGWDITVTTSTGAEVSGPDDEGNYTVTVTPGMVITFTNTVYTIRALKADKEGKPLVGAEFQLQKLTDAENDSWTDIGETQTTGADGAVSWTGLLTGDYRIAEITAPEGYVKLRGPYEIAIPADGNGETTVEVTIVNGRAPQTGGSGTLLYTVLGLVILGGAGMMFAVLRRKKGCV